MFNANVGPDNGALACLEAFFGRPLQRCPCQLHANELGFRAAFVDADGTTSGPKSFSGLIGKSLQENLTDFEVVQFAKVPFKDFPRNVGNYTNDLSTAQEYLFDIVVQLWMGTVHLNWQIKNLGC